ncbi:MAG: ATP-dependent Clp protease ATP-binding subunit [Oscillospiraceae bacterium]|jgi:ATP-dependent Clp protease ATP-binding subunit ClpA|nr:ATP-dependent Clp protease ATP-binding subunit [Oscillospiraceae bacterium]
MLCSLCNKRPAQVTIGQTDQDGNSVQQSLCIPCAMKMNLGPVTEMLKNMGIPEEELEGTDEMMENLLDNMDMEGFMPPSGTQIPMFGMFRQPPGRHSEDDDGDNTDAPLLGSKTPQDSGKTPSGNVPSKDAKSKRDKCRAKPEKEPRKYLSKFCTDLTSRAREGKVDQIIGREREIARAVQILCRRTKNNPCLIGEPGVGKTAIAEGLALRIAAGEVPAKLAPKEIQLLDLTALVAGTSYRGQFEARMRGLLEEVKREGNIILFIDEVHNLVGAGGAEDAMNAANILKPALSRGEIQIIGATTFNEYRKHIEKDSALERRLQPVKVEEPSIEDACEVLLGIKGYYEEYHRVRISDALVRQTVTLSERYINDRFLPDKAIDILDEACTACNLRNPAISALESAEAQITELNERVTALEADTDIDYEEVAKLKVELLQAEDKLPELREKAADNRVTQEDLARAIQLWTGIPAQKILESDLRRLGELEEHLKAKLIGQDEAVQLVAAAVRRGRVQISTRRRPASFIFVGPTGVGKTELVKLLAAELFDTPETLIRLDMSEFMEKHAVSRIIGSPPGYVGYDEAGQLTEKVRRKPYSILLFDEIEKAHPDVMNILLQILDEGKITDAHGRTVDFGNTVIVMTSNAGSDRKENALGFGKAQGDFAHEKALAALKDFLRPEFLGRVDEVVVFRDLAAADYERIAALMLDELVAPLKDKGIAFTWKTEVPAFLSNGAENGARGARDLRGILRKQVEDKIATLLVNNTDESLTAIALDVSGNELLVTGEK